MTKKTRTERRHTGFKDYRGCNIYEGDILENRFMADGEELVSRCEVYFNTVTGQWVLDMSYRQNKSYSEPLYSELTLRKWIRS